MYIMTEDDGFQQFKGGLILKNPLLQIRMRGAATLIMWDPETIGREPSYAVSKCSAHRNWENKWVLV